MIIESTGQLITIDDEMKVVMFVHGSVSFLVILVIFLQHGVEILEVQGVCWEDFSTIGIRLYQNNP